MRKENVATGCLYRESAQPAKKWLGPLGPFGPRAEETGVYNPHWRRWLTGRFRPAGGGRPGKEVLGRMPVRGGTQFRVGGDV
jgi:hypothetical protein